MISDVLVAYDDAVSDDPYVHRSPVSMSMLGRCRRQAAYAITLGWPEQPGVSGPQAYLGAAIHARLLPDLADRLRGRYEQPVTLTVGPVELTGTADLVLRDQVVDLKTVSQYYYGVVSERIPYAHRMQVTGYSLALGKPLCTLLYVNRSDGERFAETWEADTYAEDVRQWVHQSTWDPEEVERDQRGPGLSMVCDSCPFAERCWGPVEPFQKPQGVMVNEHGVDMAIESYADAREREKEAKADKEFWRDALVGVPNGPYSEFRLAWSIPRDREVFDTETAKRLLEEAGLPVPMKEVRGTSSINVTKNRKKTDD